MYLINFHEIFKGSQRSPDSALLSIENFDMTYFKEIINKSVTPILTMYFKRPLCKFVKR